jgi:hypothetical protein
MGISPAGENGTFLQNLVLRRATTDNAMSKAVLIDQLKNVDSLTVGKDIIVMPSVLQPSSTLEAQLIFVGYGIEVPGKYSDYEKIDVKGKIVVFLNGTPKNLELPSTLVAHFANAASKMEIASQKGAVGAIIAPDAALARFSSSNAITVAMNPEKTEAFGRSVSGNLHAVARIPFATLQRLFFSTEKKSNTNSIRLKKWNAIFF